MDLREENAKLLNYYVKVMERYKTCNKSALHRLTYTELRSKSDFPSALIQTSRDKAVEAFKSYKKRKQKGLNSSLPVFDSNAPIRFDSRCFNIIETDNKLKYFASVSVRGERVFVPLLGQRYQHKYLRALLNGFLSIGTIELIKKGDDFYFYISMKKEVDVRKPSSSNVFVGVDLGLVNLSTSVILGEKPACVNFFKGNQAIAKRNYFASLRKSFGKKKLLRKIKQTKEKESMFMRDLNHKVSNSIIQQACSVKNSVIVLENLKHIRKKMRFGKKLNKQLHSWSFNQLQQFIEYKANWQGIPVVFISPKYTSQKCNKCNHTEKANRTGRIFKCKKCGYESNSDFNAAINISKNFSSSYMFEEMGDVATPLTSAKNNESITESSN